MIVPLVVYHPIMLYEETMSQTITPLSNAEVRAVTSRAEGKYKASLGKRPTMKDVSQGYNSTHNLTAIHIFAIFVAFLMFIVTLVKVWEHQSLLVVESYAHWVSQITAQGYSLATIPGFVLIQNLVATLYQTAFSMATEVSMILFLVWFQTTPRRKLTRSTWPAESTPSLRLSISSLVCRRSRAP